MAIIRNNKNNMNISAIWEDPRPSGDLVFLWGDGHNKNTLAHKWDSNLQHNAAGTGVTGWGVPALALSTTYRADFVMYLADETVHLVHQSTTVNSDLNNLDITPLLSMDESNICNHHKYIVSNTGDNAIYSSYCQFQSAGQTLVYNTRYNHVGSIDTSLPTKNTTVGSFNFWPIWWNDSTGNLIGYSATNGSYPFMNGGPGRARNVLTAAGVTTITYEYPAHVNNKTDQFMGVASDGRSMWFRNTNGSDYTHTILKYDDVANTVTSLYTFTAIPTAGGTSAGGNRGTSFGQQLFKFASKTFDNPLLSSGNKAFYVPYLDVNGFYHPMLFTWNVNTNVVERNTNITMAWGAGRVQGDVWAPETDSASAVNVTHNIQRYWYNETFRAADDEGVSKRYLCFFQTHGDGVRQDADQRRRTIVTFTVDETNLTTLTYHSHVAVPRTIKNTIWLDDERTLLGVFTWDNFYTYKFSPDPLIGWQLTANLPYRFESVGRDSFGRIWAVDPGPLFHGRLHILTPSVPATVSVSLAESSYNYSGTDIDSTGTVNAFGVSGERLAVSVKLRVEGPSLKIINNELEEVSELIITTSATEDTVINIKVIDAGSSSIFASLEI